MYPIKLSGTSDFHGRTNDNLTSSVPVKNYLPDRPKPKNRCDCIGNPDHLHVNLQRLEWDPAAPEGHYGVE